MTPRVPRPSDTCLIGQAVEQRLGFAVVEQPPRVFYDGRALPLRPMAALLLGRLASAPFVSKTDLRGTIANDRTLNVHLCAIRRALPPGLELQNEFAKGYRLVAV